MSTAAVGSLMIRTTSRPASSPASRVASRWPSLKKAGTVITAFWTGWPSSFSARCLSVRRMIAEISWGVYFWSPSGTVTSSPIRRLIERTVRSGASMNWFRAALADEQPALRVEADDRGQDRVAVLVGQHDGLAVADDRHLAVGRPQVDAEDGFHECLSRVYPGRPSLRQSPRDEGVTNPGPDRARTVRATSARGTATLGPRRSGAPGPARCSPAGLPRPPGRAAGSGSSTTSTTVISSGSTGWPTQSIRWSLLGAHRASEAGLDQAVAFEQGVEQRPCASGLCRRTISRACSW